MSENIDFQTLSKIQFDAAVSLTGAVARKIGKIVTEAHDYSTTSLQSNAALIRKLARVKSIDQLIHIQFDHAKASYEASLGWSKKLGELLADLPTNVIKPVTVSAKNANDSAKVRSVGKTLQAAE